jgi:hypothetical protein
MAVRITQNDLDVALEVYVLRLESLGMPHENIALIEGSKKSGNSFKLVYIDPETGGHKPAPGASQGFLGWTKREAHDRLTTISYTLFDVLFHLEG